jgi:hypothetical protein
MATEPQSSDLYEADFYAWALAQARSRQARRLGAPDLGQSEETQRLAGAERSAALDRLRRVMEHLLKLQHCPAAAPRDLWRASVRDQRRQMRIDLTPGLERTLAKALPGVYAMARDAAAAALRDHGEEVAADALPARCPYSLDQITGDWLP